MGKAVDLLSGPGGLAWFLRRRQLGRPAGRPEPAAGHRATAETIPAGIRNAVILRDQHCRWAGGCNQPASACEVHHVRHKANGGKTSTKDCVLLCFFHHQVVIHRWGWTLVLNPDGTTTAWNKDKTKVLHSHSPPPGPGNPPGSAWPEKAGVCLSPTGDRVVSCSWRKTPQPGPMTLADDTPGAVGLVNSGGSVGAAAASEGDASAGVRFALEHGLSPGKIGDITKAALVLVQFEHK